MASPAPDYTPGTMEITEQRKTFSAFTGLVKWGSLLTAAILLHLCIWFATEAGFLAATGVAIVVLALGVFLLRSKPGDVDSLH
jgi:hypothetical protein